MRTYAHTHKDVYLYVHMYLLHTEFRLLMFDLCNDSIEYSYLNTKIYIYETYLILIHLMLPTKCIIVLFNSTNVFNVCFFCKYVMYVSRTNVDLDIC